MDDGELQKLERAFESMQKNYSEAKEFNDVEQLRKDVSNLAREMGSLKATLDQLTLPPQPQLSDQSNLSNSDVQDLKSFVEKHEAWFNEIGSQHNLTRKGLSHLGDNFNAAQMATGNALTSVRELCGLNHLGDNFNAAQMATGTALTSVRELCGELRANQSHLRAEIDRLTRDNERLRARNDATEAKLQDLALAYDSLLGQAHARYGFQSTSDITVGGFTTPAIDSISQSTASAAKCAFYPPTSTTGHCGEFTTLSADSMSQSTASAAPSYAAKCASYPPTSTTGYSEHSATTHSDIVGDNLRQYFSPPATSMDKRSQPISAEGTGPRSLSTSDERFFSELSSLFAITPVATASEPLSAVSNDQVSSSSHPGRGRPAQVATTTAALASSAAGTSSIVNHSDMTPASGKTQTSLSNGVTPGSGKSQTSLAIGNATSAASASLHNHSVQNCWAKPLAITSAAAATSSNLSQSNKLPVLPAVSKAQKFLGAALPSTAGAVASENLHKSSTIPVAQTTGKTQKATATVNKPEVIPTANKANKAQKVLASINKSEVIPTAGKAQKALATVNKPEVIPTKAQKKSVNKCSYYSDSHKPFYKYPDTQQVIVSSIPQHLSNDYLREICSQYGKVLLIYRGESKRRASFDYAFVIFESEKSVQTLATQNAILVRDPAAVSSARTIRLNVMAKKQVKSKEH